MAGRGGGDLMESRLLLLVVLLDNIIGIPLPTYLSSTPETHTHNIVFYVIPFYQVREGRTQKNRIAAETHFRCRRNSN